MGRKRRDGPTREGLRLHWLILQLERKGMTGAELARRTGVLESHINGFKNIETSGRTGIGAEIIRRMQDGLGLDVRYFFDPYEGERPHDYYLLDAKRELKRSDKMAQDVAELSQRLADSESRYAQLEARMERRLAAVESSDRQPAGTRTARK